MIDGFWIFLSVCVICWVWFKIKHPDKEPW